MNKILETERLILSTFSLNDAPFVLKLVNTPSWLQFIGDRNIHSIGDAEQYLSQGPIKSYAENGFGLSLVILKDENIPIGMCGLVNRDTLKDIDIGFALMPQYTDKGYAYEIASATMEYAKSVLKMEKIVAITDANNTSSIKLLNKLGLHYEKMISLNTSELVQLYS